MNELISVFAVLLAIFLFGIAVMRIGLELLSKRIIRQLLMKMTDTPWKGFIIGILVTAIVQSSSVVMVMLIGLVAAGVLRFKQTIGVILGTNIGTTVTAEIIAFNVTDAVLPLLVIGACSLLVHRQKIFATGCICFGLGSVFVSMNGLEGLAEPLADIKFVHQLLLAADHNHLAGTTLGALFTALIQSSSAATGVAMAFIGKGQLSLSAAVAFVLGANVGTCITAWIASFGANKEAKMAAFTHIMVNAAGVIIFFPFVEQLSVIAEHLTQSSGKQLAHAGVVFNILCSLAILPFARRLGDFCEHLFGKGRPD